MPFGRSLTYSFSHFHDRRMPPSHALSCLFASEAMCADDDILQVRRVDYSLSKLSEGAGSTASRRLQLTTSEAVAAHQVKPYFEPVCEASEVPHIVH